MWGLLAQWLAETTAHSLAATLGFLSINEDIQEEAFQQIISVAGYDRDPVSITISTKCPNSTPGVQVFEDYPKLDKILATFYEALRMFRKYQS